LCRDGYFRVKINTISTWIFGDVYLYIRKKKIVFFNYLLKQTIFKFFLFKTSVTSTAGAYIILIGGIGFILGCVDKMFLDNSVDIINQSIMMVTIGAGLLGIKNITGGKNQFLNAKAEQIKSETEESQQ